jgi:hypothetical protein
MITVIKNFIRHNEASINEGRQRKIFFVGCFCGGWLDVLSHTDFWTLRVYKEPTLGHFVILVKNRLFLHNNICGKKLAY